MSDTAALEAFLDKWRARWPEWRIAEAFVPAPQRAATLAWLALRQELADAAWGGEDPRPGAAKLAWWVDELQGWANGRRRHPLGLALQRIAAPWEALAVALPSLSTARALSIATPDDLSRWRAAIAPFADAGARVSAVVAGAPAGADADAADMRAHDLAANDDSAFAVALGAMRALAGEGADATTRAGLEAWPARAVGTRADRIFAALARQRLQALADGAGDGRTAASHWRSLWTAWRAGRSVPRA